MSAPEKGAAREAARQRRVLERAARRQAARDTTAAAVKARRDHELALVGTAEATETCRCGGALLASGKAETVAETVGEWRRIHGPCRVERTRSDVGWCGDRADLLSGRTTTCIIDHGHAGWHSDLNGANWAQAPKDAP